MEELILYINSWGNYNEGKSGKSITLPMPEEELREALKDPIFGRDPELFIQDLDTAADGIGEHTSIILLNEIWNYINDHSNVEAFFALLEMFPLDEAYALLQADDYVFFEGKTLEELAQEEFDEGMFSTDYLLQFIDFEAIARDMSFGDYTETEQGVILLT